MLAFGARFKCIHVHVFCSLFLFGVFVCFGRFFHPLSLHNNMTACFWHHLSFCSQRGPHWSESQWMRDIIYRECIYGIMSSFDDMLVHPIADHRPGSKRERAQEKIIVQEAPRGVEGEWVSGRVSDRILHAYPQSKYPSSSARSLEIWVWGVYAYPHRIFAGESTTFTDGHYEVWEPFKKSLVNSVTRIVECRWDNILPFLLDTTENIWMKAAELIAPQDHYDSANSSFINTAEAIYNGQVDLMLTALASYILRQLLMIIIILPCMSTTIDSTVCSHIQPGLSSSVYRRHECQVSSVWLRLSKRQVSSDLLQPFNHLNTM